MMIRKKLIWAIITIAVIITIIVFSISRKARTQISETISSFFPQTEERIIPVVPSQGGIVLPEGATTTPGIERLVLTQTSKSAVSGAAFFDGKVRFIEKATGHLYESGPQGENLTRLSNTTIPKIFEVYWSPKKDHAVLKYLQDENLRIFSAFFNGSSTQGIFLSPQISTIATSPNEDKIFYIAPAGNANVGIIASFEDKNKRQIFSLPFGDFIASWPSKDTISLLTRPSGIVPGFLYALDLKSHNIKKLLEHHNGLEVLWDSNADQILYSDYENNGLFNLIFSKKENKNMYFLGASTFPAKCVFSKLEGDTVFCGVPKILPVGTYPDNWFEGKMSFEDSLLKINYAVQTVKILHAQENFDAINPFLSDDESFLFFTNKADGTLWSLKLK